MTTRENMVQVYFELPEGGPASEHLWARALGDDLFELANVPFFVEGVALGDVVRALPALHSSSPKVVEVVRRSGNTTVLVSCDPDNHQEALDAVRARGCETESAKRGVFAVSVPAGVDADEIADMLEGEGAEVFVNETDGEAP